MLETLTVVSLVLLLSVSELRCAEIQNGKGMRMMERNMVAIPQIKPMGPLGMLLTPSSLDAIMSMLNRTGETDFPSMGDADLERMKRAQGPITELYGCLLTLFLNPACWNRFENNQLRYLQYLYLRRRLKMMEQDRLKAMNGTGTMVEPKMQAGKKPMPMPGPKPAVPAPGAPPQDIPMYARILMRYFPHLSKKIASVQMKAQGIQKVVVKQTAQARGVAKQTFGAVAQKVKAMVPVVQQRAMTLAGQAAGHAKTLMQQALAAIGPTPISGEAQGQMMRPVKKN